MNESISVIIPCRNNAHLIAETLDSVLSQTLVPQEVIVVDDGSEDESCNVVNEFGSRVQLIRQPPTGNASARNAGVRASHGEYICFLDSDDVWLPKKLERQIEYMQTHSALVSFPGAERFHENGTVERPTAGPPSRSKLWSYLVDYQPFVSSLSGVMMHRHCFETVRGFDEQLKLSVDWDMWIRLAKHFALHWFDDVLVRVRVHSGGACRNTELRLHMYLQCLKKHRKLFSNLGMSLQWSRSYSNKLLRLGRYLLKQGKIREARPFLLGAMRYNWLQYCSAKVQLLAESYLRTCTA